MRAYARMVGGVGFPRHGYVVVDTPTYMVAVNTVLARLRADAASPDNGTLQRKWAMVATQATPFSAEELATVAPY